MKRAVIPIATVALTCLPYAGCANQTQQKNQLQLYCDIDAMSIVADSNLLKVDNDKYFDGVKIQVYLYRAEDRKPVAGKGWMVFQLMKRVKAPGGGPLDQELYKWELSPDQVAASINADKFGLIGHGMSLYWGDVKPTAGVFLRGQFIPERGGRIVYSRPVSLPLPLK